jgi:hypothetical protein
MVTRVPAKYRNGLLIVLIVIALMLPELRPVLALILGVAAAILIPLAIGFVVSLPALLTPVRRLGQASRASRIAESIMLAVLTFGICFVSLSWVEAATSPSIWAIMGFSVGQNVIPYDEPIHSGTVQELWTRALIPPPLRGPCYSHVEAVCSQADLIIRGTFGGPNAWADYLLLVGLSLIPAAFCAVFVWRHTRSQSLDRLVDAH